jgi:hypothetical protein
MSKKVATTASGAWTVEEEKKLVSALETFGSHNWANIAVNVRERTVSQCYQKWLCRSRKAATAVTGIWTVEEEIKLVYAVETFGATSWANIAANVPGRNEKQCYDKWQAMSKKAASTVTGTWTVEEEKKLASAVETFGTTNWDKVAGNVPGRNDKQCWSKWQYLSRKAAPTVSATWTVQEEMMLVYAVEAYDGRNWAEITKMVPGRTERQCRYKWQRLSVENVDAESVPKTDAAVLSQLSGLEVGPDLHVFPRDTQKFLALLGITTARLLLGSNVEELAASYVGWKCETVSIDDARAFVLEWKTTVALVSVGAS